MFSNQFCSVIHFLAVHHNAPYVPVIVSPKYGWIYRVCAALQPSSTLRSSAWSCGRHWLSLKCLSASITTPVITMPLEATAVSFLNLQPQRSFCRPCLTCALWDKLILSSDTERHSPSVSLFYQNPHIRQDGPEEIKRACLAFTSDAKAQKIWHTPISYSREDMNLLQHCTGVTWELKTIF